MSEHQYVEFLAVDAPVSKENLKYIRTQSSRAEISTWRFRNEYHYGDFNGNAKEMLRRGYDIHVHYANFGTRRVMLRLPAGLPDKTAAAKYFERGMCEFLPDKVGSGGILNIDLGFEETEDFYEFGKLMKSLVEIRAQVMAGDLRPLYVARLAVALDMNHDPDEEVEGPVPGGLGESSRELRMFASYLDISTNMLRAAAKGSPPIAARDDHDKNYSAWLGKLPAAKKDEWLKELISEPNAKVKDRLLAEYQKANPSPSWPTAIVGRTVSELQQLAEGVVADAKQKADARAAKLREERLAKMVADPNQVLKETEKLVKNRTTADYATIASLLADLREALADGPQSDLADKQARKLKEAHPSYHALAAALRKQGFVKKEVRK